MLLYGDYPALARRVLGSIGRHCRREDYRLVVGMNAVGERTARYVRALQQRGAVDALVRSARNLSKCPMMRRMFARVETEYVWWLDDDSHLTEPETLERWLSAACAAPPETVVWGRLARCDHPDGFTRVPDVLRFVRTAPWYRGLPPPSWRPGGKGEFDHGGSGGGDGRWFFVLGGGWLARMGALRKLDWPDRRLEREGDDVFLGEAIRQQGWSLGRLDLPGVVIDAEDRRGDPDSGRRWSGGVGSGMRRTETRTLAK